MSFEKVYRHSLTVITSLPLEWIIWNSISQLELTTQVGWHLTCTDPLLGGENIAVIPGG